MAIWKQLLGLVIAVGLLVLAVDRFVPGGRAYLVDLGLGPETPQDAAGGPRGGAGSGPGGGGPRATLVVLGEATQVTINDRVTALGAGAAVRSATLLPSSSGLLTEVRVRSGTEVAAGEVVALLDQSSEQVAFDAARIALDDALTTLERNRRLSGGPAVSAAQMQAYQLAADKAQLALRQARIDLDNRRIVSPIAGTIGIIKVNPGIEITPSTEIATVEDNSVIKVVFSLPERFVGRVRPGDTALAVPVAQAASELVATVTAVDNRVDETTGTFEVEAQIANDERMLRSGMSFTVNMRFAGEDSIAVPPLAVQWGSDGAYVWRVIERAVHRAPVKVVQRNAESVLVAGDLAAGDQVVVEGVDGLKEGSTVRLADDPPPGSGGGAQASSRTGAPPGAAQGVTIRASGGGSGG